MYLHIVQTIFFDIVSIWNMLFLTAKKIFKSRWNIYPKKIWFQSTGNWHCWNFLESIGQANSLKIRNIYSVHFSIIIEIPFNTRDRTFKKLYPFDVIEYKRGRSKTIHCNSICYYLSFPFYIDWDILLQVHFFLAQSFSILANLYTYFTFIFTPYCQKLFSCLTQMNCHQ